MRVPFGNRHTSKPDGEADDNASSGGRVRATGMVLYFDMKLAAIDPETLIIWVFYQSAFLELVTKALRVSFRRLPISDGVY